MTDQTMIPVRDREHRVLGREGARALALLGYKPDHKLGDFKARWPAFAKTAA